ncbi:MAG: tetratricopeptide repeat protein [Candidatus Protochlamydia sp.]|nr:tetratricopeptide repeat protein [Candidatus Protochlamydia sp.]
MNISTLQLTNTIYLPIKAAFNSLDKTIVSLALAALVGVAAIWAIYRYMNRPVRQQPINPLPSNVPQNPTHLIQETPQQPNQEPQRPNDIPQNNPLVSIQELLQSGRSLHDQRNFTQSTIEFKKILESDPQNIDALYGIAKNVQEEDSKNSAPTWQHLLDVYQNDSFVNLDPFNSFIYSGEALFQLNRLDEAIKKHHEALIIQPNNAKLLHKVSLMYLNLQKLEEASEYASRAAQIDPDYLNYSKDMIHTKCLIENFKLSIEKASVHGKVRTGNDLGPLPTFNTICNVIDTFELTAAGFSCCFHTTESLQEILDLLTKIRVAHPPKWAPFGCTTIGVQSLTNLYNNIVKLHDALPGDAKLKNTKIYWNALAEEVLLPYLFNDEDCKIQNLLFTVTPGEPSLSAFQAPSLNFNQQLQFVGIDKKQIFADMQQGIEHLSKNIIGIDIYPEIIKIISKKHYANSLMDDAISYKIQLNIINNLLKIKNTGLKINFQGMTTEQKSEFFQNLAT